MLYNNAPPSHGPTLGWGREKRRQPLAAAGEDGLRLCAPRWPLPALGLAEHAASVDLWAEGGVQGPRWASAGRRDGPGAVLTC